MNTKSSLKSSAGHCNNFNTYGNVPTERACETAFGPKSKNFASKRNACFLCCLLKST